MGDPCPRWYKCTCFQCEETDCERYEPEPPKQLEELMKDDLMDDFMQRLKKIKEERGGR